MAHGMDIRMTISYLTARCLAWVALVAMLCGTGCKPLELRGNEVISTPSKKHAGSHDAAVEDASSADAGD